MFSVGGG